MSKTVAQKNQIPALIVARFNLLHHSVPKIGIIQVTTYISIEIFIRRYSRESKIFSPPILLTHTLTHFKSLSFHNWWLRCIVEQNGNEVSIFFFEIRHCVTGLWVLDILIPLLCLKMSRTNCPVMWHHAPREGVTHLHCYKNLKTCREQ